MAITVDDIKIYKSEYMTDEDNGGGNMTNQLVECGAIANIFPNISREDRLNGNISLRKLFLRVLTEDTSVYSGVHQILYQTTNDPNVSFFLMPYNLQTRLDTAKYIEDYTLDTGATIHPMWRIPKNIKKGDYSISTRIKYEKYNFVVADQNTLKGWILLTTLDGERDASTNIEYSDSAKYKFQVYVDSYVTKTEQYYIYTTYTQTSTRTYQIPIKKTKVYEYTIQSTQVSAQNLSTVNGKIGRWEKTPDSINNDVNIINGEIFQFIQTDGSYNFLKQEKMQVSNVENTTYVLSESDYSKECQIYKTIYFITPFQNDYLTANNFLITRTTINNNFRIYGSIKTVATNSQYLLPINSINSRIVPAIPIKEKITFGYDVISSTKKYLFTLTSPGAVTINNNTINNMSEYVFETCDLTEGQNYIALFLKYKFIATNTIKINIVTNDKNVSITDNGSELVSIEDITSSIDYANGTISINLPYNLSMNGKLFIEYQTFGFFQKKENYYIAENTGSSNVCDIDFKMTNIVPQSITGTVTVSGNTYEYSEYNSKLKVKTQNLNYTLSASEYKSALYDDMLPYFCCYGNSKILFVSQYQFSVSNDFGKTFSIVGGDGSSPYYSTAVFQNIAINDNNGVYLVVKNALNGFYRVDSFLNFTSVQALGTITALTWGIIDTIDVFVCNMGSIIYTSSDGITWTAKSSLYTSANCCYLAVIDNNIYIGFPNGGIRINNTTISSTLNSAVKLIKKIGDKIICVDAAKNIMILKDEVVASYGSPFSSVVGTLYGFDVDSNGNAMASFGNIPTYSGAIYSCSNGKYTQFSDWVLERTHSSNTTTPMMVIYAKDHWYIQCKSSLKTFKTLNSSKNSINGIIKIGDISLDTGLGQIKDITLSAIPFCEVCLSKDIHYSFFINKKPQVYGGFNYLDGTSVDGQLTTANPEEYLDYSVISSDKGIDIHSIFLYYKSGGYIYDVSSQGTYQLKTVSYYKPTSQSLNVACLPLDGLIPVFSVGNRIVVKSVDLLTEEENLINSFNDSGNGESGNIQTINELQQSFLAGATICASTSMGDLQAKVTLTPFDQVSWDGVTWSDTRQGSPATATYDFANYPIVLTNAGCETERWALKCTNASPLTFQVIGERIGIIGSVDVTSQDIAIANVNTVSAYFTIDKDGFGAGWQSGNIIRFNTEVAGFPFWVGRVVNAASSDIDTIEAILEIKGDVE